MVDFNRQSCLELGGVLEAAKSERMATSKQCTEYGGLM